MGCTRRFSRRFTHVDPFEDTESSDLKRAPGQRMLCFTHVDPFEDTERQEFKVNNQKEKKSFTHVDPFEDTES